MHYARQGRKWPPGPNVICTTAPVQPPARAVEQEIEVREDRGFTSPIVRVDVSRLLERVQQRPQASERFLELAILEVAWRGTFLAEDVPAVSVLDVLHQLLR